MKKRLIRSSVFALIVASILFPSSLQSGAGEYKLLILDGRHAGLCVDASSRGAHESHGDNFLQIPDDENSFVICSSR